MNKLIIIQNLIILFVFIHCTSFAQVEPKLKTISNNVGEVIDAEERYIYGLFDEYDDDKFEKAQFFENSDNSKLLVVYFKDGTIMKKALTQFEYFEYKAQINKRPIDYNGIDSTKLCVVKLTDETSISGKIIDVREKEIKMRTQYLDLITISKKRIIDIVELESDGSQINKYWLPNPHDSRHFFAPTGRNMPKGTGYFQDIYLVLLSVNYAVTDFLTLGGGFSIIPGEGFNSQAYYVYPKVGFDLSEKTSVGGGFLFASIPERTEHVIPDTITIPVRYAPTQYDTTIVDTVYAYSNNRTNIGLLFGVGTFGNRENNVSLGVGYAYYKDDVLKYPIIMLGGMYRLSRRTAFVTENWIFTVPYKYLDEEYEKRNYTSAVISYGIRFFGERMSVDLAFFQITGEMGIGQFIFPGIPYVDFVVKF
ncbi:MAG: hypothetical protein KAS71_03205 [Bacteroidales bacterium]|nr:hypothetical protein [Bacteroidales bacterium]